MAPRALARQGQPARMASVTLPAPVGGLNTVSAGAAMPPSDCMGVWNLVAAEYGLRTRLGYREWVTGLTGAADNLVRSVIPFTGSTAGTSRLFATTSSGIYDVSASTPTPAAPDAFALTTGDAGYGVSRTFVNAAGHHLLYCDEVNGYHLRTESVGTWAAVPAGAGAGQLAGLDPTKAVFATSHKQRVWFVERDTANAWYLDPGLITGLAVKFPMGGQFRAGGHLVGLYSWTVDGGVGLDDYLVALSSGGDVVVWQGTDPADASKWALRGTWYVGDLPAGRQCFTDAAGGSILTRQGLLPLSRLLAGAGEDKSALRTAKVGNLLNALMLSKAAMKGWSIRLHPSDATLLITVPSQAGQATTQLAQASGTGGWFPYRDLPIYSSEVWGGSLYFGTTDGRVCINDGYVDGVSLADSNAYTPVQWSLLSAYSNLGSTRTKQVQAIRPTLLSEGAPPAYVAEARYGYSLQEVAPVSAGVGGNPGTWDAALWDAATWAGEYQASQQATGALGMGRDVAVAIRGTATSRTVLVGVDVLFTVGGHL